MLLAVIWLLFLDVIGMQTSTEMKQNNNKACDLYCYMPCNKIEKCAILGRV